MLISAILQHADASGSVGRFSDVASRSERLVEIGEASESSDEGESEVFNARDRKKSNTRSASSIHGELLPLLLRLVAD